MFVQVRNVRLFYEKTGAGPAVLLLHGNGEDHSIFNALVPELAKTHTVYALDSRCHGQSGCPEQSSSATPLSYDAMAQDVEAFIDALGLKKPALCGFSDGGIVGLLAASHSPQLFSRLIICSANTNPRGLKPSLLLYYRLVYAINRSPHIGMMLTQPNIPPAALGKITIPVLVLAGSRDVIRREHTRQLANTLPNSQLMVLPRETHSSYVVNSPKLYPLVISFLQE